MQDTVFLEVHLPFCFWAAIFPNGRDLILISSGIYHPLFPQGERMGSGVSLFEDRITFNISWINTLTCLFPPNQKTCPVSEIVSLAHIAVYSPQSIVLAGYFPVPTKQKLLNFQSQEVFFSLVCSVILFPEAVTAKYLCSWFGEGVLLKRYQEMLDKNSLTDISEYHLSLHIETVNGLEWWWYGDGGCRKSGVWVCCTQTELDK